MALTARDPALGCLSSIGKNFCSVNAPVVKGDGFTLRVLEVSDAEVWKLGEDAEQLRWFEAPGPAPIKNIVAAIENWRSGWANNGPVRQWGIWLGDDLAGGVELRARTDGNSNVSYLVFPHARGQRLASRAVRLATQWALHDLGVSAVVAVIDDSKHRLPCNSNNSGVCARRTC